jgi:hypothetical protein
VAEVSSIEHERLFGETKLHAVRNGLRVLRTVAAEWSRRADGQSMSVGLS